jgi:plastocyanin
MKILGTVSGAILAVVLAVALAACGGHKSTMSMAQQRPATETFAAAPNGGATIAIKNFAFDPSTLTVTPGERVTVRNEDSATHTVTAGGAHEGAFNTGNINPGSTATFTAPSQPGSYSYICQIHQFMHGTLTVN